MTIGYYLIFRNINHILDFLQCYKMVNFYQTNDNSFWFLLIFFGHPTDLKLIFSSKLRAMKDDIVVLLMRVFFSICLCENPIFTSFSISSYSLEVIICPFLLLIILFFNVCLRPILTVESFGPISNLAFVY